MRSTSKWGAVALVATFAAAAGADDSRFGIAVFGGVATTSGESSWATQAIDGYGTIADNTFHQEGDQGTSWGASFDWKITEGARLELHAERATLDAGGDTDFGLAWDSIEGPQAESFALASDDGELKLTPLSLNLGVDLLAKGGLRLAFSGGATWMTTDLDATHRFGVATYDGDLIEAVAVEAEVEGDASDWTWNAGLVLDWTIAGGCSVFFDGRYYGDAGVEIESVTVRPGTYSGLHFGDDVEISAEEAATWSANLDEATAASELETDFIRAAVGLRFRF